MKNIFVPVPINSKSITKRYLQSINGVLHSVGLHCDKLQDNWQSQDEKITSKNGRHGDATSCQLNYLKFLCKECNTNLDDLRQEEFQDCGNSKKKLSNREADKLIKELEKKQKDLGGGF